MLRKTIRLVSLFSFLVLAGACGGDDDGGDDDTTPTVDADTTPAVDASVDTPLPAMTVCGAAMCPSATQICVFSGAGIHAMKTCTDLPAGCAGTTDAERTCATCGDACGADTCVDNANENAVACE